MIALRKLVFGETWVLPVGILVLVAGAVVLGEVGGRWWHDAGGFALLAGVAVLLAAAVRPSPRDRSNDSRPTRARARAAVCQAAREGSRAAGGRAG